MNDEMLKLLAEFEALDAKEAATNQDDDIRWGELCHRLTPWLSVEYRKLTKAPDNGGELKPCSTCGKEADYTDRWGHPLPRGTISMWCACGYHDHITVYSVDEWQSRPIEDAQAARIAELEEKNATLYNLMVSGEKRGVEKATAEYSARIAELETHLGYLLAVIHGDGGQYQAERGTAHAVEDAIKKWHERGARFIFEGKWYKLSEEQPGHVVQDDDRWIPVGERLPEDLVNVLCIDTSGEIFKANVCDGFWYHSSGSDVDANNVTHWRPLPEPPQ